MTMFAAEAVYKALSADTAERVDIITREITASTNLDIKELAQGGAAEGTVVIAGSQTAGRGRRGRSFWSCCGWRGKALRLSRSFSEKSRAGVVYCLQTTEER